MSAHTDHTLNYLIEVDKRVRALEADLDTVSVRLALLEDAHKPFKAVEAVDQ
jgi:hypothetical protein